MKKAKVAPKLQLRRVTVQGLSKTAGAAVYESYGAYCSGSCNSCHAGTGCGILAPSEGNRICGHYY